MKNKLITITLITLFIINISFGIYGLFLNTNKTKDVGNSTNESIKPHIAKIEYKYYLEDEEINEMPKNNIITNEDGTTTIDENYVFSKYECTNDVKGNFDTENWIFNLDNKNNKDSVCNLYFLKAKYEVSFVLTNAIENENNEKLVKRETDGIFKLIPNDGYTFKNAICSNNKEAIWDETTQTLKIIAITKETTCNVDFEKKLLNINIIVKNGTGNTNETIYYGDNKSIIIEPNEGYDNAKIACTNNQTATFENNTLNFEKITNNTECTVTFNKIVMKNHKLIISNPTEIEDFTLISDAEQSIETGKDGKIVVRATNGIIPILNCGDTIPTQNELESSDNTKTIEFSFYNMSNDITCQLSK